MLFNTWTFAVFFVIVYGLYRLLPYKRQNLLLLAASYVFYGWWDYRFLSLIWISTVLDYICGRAIHSAGGGRKRKAFLAASIAGNLGILGFFKYFNFFAGSFAKLLGSLGLQANLPTLHIILPVGISFYTFQTMSYTIDIYRGQLKPTRDFLQFAVFVAFFPQLVAGPIERARNLLPQFARPRQCSAEKFRDGLWLVFWGLFKKVVVADNMARIVNAAFANPSAYGGADLFIAVNAFAFQIYGDFSGYSSIARGVAKMLGFELMVNFRFPYFATSPSDFWRRWHISLSSWLRDYLYIPLGGNRRGKRRTYANLMTTMLLGGLWHGAAWHFVLWGFYHGLILCIYRLFGGASTHGRRIAAARPPAAGLPSPWPAVKWLLAAAVMYQLTCAGWLIFRAQDLATIWTFARGIALDWRLSATGAQWAHSMLLYCWFLLAVELWQFAAGAEVVLLAGRSRLVRLNVWLFVLCSLMFLSAGEGKEFIYFAF
ncbi:MAG: MBOAT family protein [Planctomycetes bacterium]|nr:MBOAT family protein [Planctomycetota bacterium]